MHKILIVYIGTIYLFTKIKRNHFKFDLIILFKAFADVQWLNGQSMTYCGIADEVCFKG